MKKLERFLKKIKGKKEKKKKTSASSSHHREERRGRGRGRGSERYFFFLLLLDFAKALTFCYVYHVAYVCFDAIAPALYAGLQLRHLIPVKGIVRIVGTNINRRHLF